MMNVVVAKLTTAMHNQNEQSVIVLLFIVMLSKNRDVVYKTHIKSEENRLIPPIKFHYATSRRPLTKPFIFYFSPMIDAYETTT